MSGPDAFPPGGVRALLRTGFVTAPTRRALQSKLDREPSEPRAFDRHAFATLQAVCDRLVPQRSRRVDIAGALDQRLADNKRSGWRYDVLPPDLEAYRRGLAGLDESAGLMFGASFLELPPERRDKVLGALAEGHPPGATWDALPAGRWFEVLLVEVAEIYFAHPLAQEAMGYLGMADAHGWAAIGLDEDEADAPARDDARF